MGVRSREVDDYINGFAGETKKCLEQIRRIINTEAPDATEGLSYGMPAYKIDGKPLVYFAGYKHHIGFYATPTGHKKFEKELSKYKQGKGSVQFPLDERMPLKLIAEITKFRMQETLRKK